MFQGIVKPLLPDSQKSPASARQFIDPLRKVNPQLASAIERLQQATDFTLNALRAEPEQADEIVFTDPQGNVIFWVGSRDGYFGGWFGQLYVGGTGPVNANLFVDNTGILTIRDALITLTSGNKEIRLDPSGPIFKMTDTDAELSISGSGDLIWFSGIHTTTLSGFSITTDGIISITSTDSSSAPTYAASYYGSVASPVFQFYMAGGTPASPSATSVGRTLGEMQFFGHDGTSFQLAGNTIVQAKSVGSGSVTSTIEHDYEEYHIKVNGTDALQVLAADQLVLGSGSATSGFNVDVKGKTRFHDTAKIDGALTLLNPTASRPLRVNSSGLVKGDKIHLDSSNDVDITGASSGDVLKWGGTSVSYYTLSALATALKTYLDSYYASATHTHNMAPGAITDTSSGHTHGLSGVSTTQPV